MAPNNSPIKPIKKVLIANRGEIARRIIRTAKKLNIGTIAVYSQADQNSLWASEADSAVCIGESSPSKSYLSIDKIINAAKTTDADAIHPGYGFLSENETFATKVREQGIVFLGPPAAAIQTMGSKSMAKKLMQQANVPVLKGYHGDNQSLEYLLATAASIGFPLMIKAASGGGGKGMRIVNKASEFKEMLASAKREAKNAFGDDKVIIERYVTNSRHIEVQILADNHGNCIHLYERDCSIQRRHQKVLEESPAPNIPSELREKLGVDAVKAAKAVDYTGVGTVEYIFDTDRHEHYFMEMNTRLQVEHPVTEMVTGLDLVEQQFRVGENRKLDMLQSDIALKGHALEARIYAEDPGNCFFPDSGTICHFKTPAPGECVRIESGFKENDQISLFYDSMIAKLVVHAKDREGCLALMSQALKETEIVGLKNNVSFLQCLLSIKEYSEGNFTTGLVESSENEWRQQLQPTFDCLLHAVVYYYICNHPDNNDWCLIPESPNPWLTLTNFTTSGYQTLNFALLLNNETLNCSIQQTENEFKGAIKKGKQIHAFQNVKIIHAKNNHLVLVNNGVQTRSKIFLKPPCITIFHSDKQHSLKIPIMQNKLKEENSHVQKGLHSPLTGKVTTIRYKEGDRVHKGNIVFVIEAMKMEHAVKAPFDCTLIKIHCVQNQVVLSDVKMADVDPCNLKV